MNRRHQNQQSASATPRRDRSASPAPLRKFRVVSRNNGKVVVEIEENCFDQMTNLFSLFVGEAKVKQEEPYAESESEPLSDRSKAPAQNDVREMQDFLRRVPHFFMGRFKKWAKMHNENEVFTFLHELQSNKKSKQGRFELGDLQKCFVIENSEQFSVGQTKRRIKDLFIEFLINEAVLQIIQYNKITTLEQKVKYIEVIPILVNEMFQDKPYENFLAQEKIQHYINKKQVMNPSTIGELHRV